MKPIEILLSLDRVRSKAPASLVAGARRFTKSAVGNARWSAAQITAAVDERRVLADALDQASQPGDLARLTRAQCDELLATKSVGRLAYMARANVPDIVPVNYLMDGAAVLVRSAAGPKLQAAERREVVAFEVDEIDEDRHTGWSVVVIGLASRVPAQGNAHPGAPRPTPWPSGPRWHTIRIEPRRVDGRRLL